jgi:beta-phosphoglucomutase-like phosphatase (HAD superfamily)
VALDPSSVAGLLFDLDGVLVDSFAAWHEVLNRALAERGLPPVDDAQMRAGWGQGIQEDSERYFRGEAVESLARTFDRLFPECIDRVVPMPGPQWCWQRSAAPVSMAVVTNTPRELAGRILAGTGLAGHFRAVAAGDDVPAGKPDPALVRLGAARLGVPLAACLFIGDTPVDVEAGRRAACRTVGFRIDADLRIEDLGGSRLVATAAPTPRPAGA